MSLALIDNHGGKETPSSRDCLDHCNYLSLPILRFSRIFPSALANDLDMRRASHEEALLISIKNIACLKAIDSN